MASLPTAADGIDLVGFLSADPSGTILIRVVDTDRTLGNSIADTVSIDEVWLRSVL